MEKKEETHDDDLYTIPRALSRRKRSSLKRHLLTVTH